MLNKVKTENITRAYIHSYNIAMEIASATMEMLEKIEAVYDKYNGSSISKRLFK